MLPGLFERRAMPIERCASLTLKRSCTRLADAQRASAASVSDRHEVFSYGRLGPE